jgi:autotransporter strand-loop-strand O-heptosyltransferase
MYKIGCFNNQDMEPELSNIIPLQKIATNILGLDFEEIKPKLNFIMGERPIQEKYITIGMSSTAGCKEWSKEGGWQDLINKLNSMGYKVAIIQREPANNIENVLDWTGDLPLSVRMNQLYHSEFYIGLSSGLSWLAWAMNKHVVMISNFTEDWNEFTENITRIKNTSVCHGCWNNQNFKFDKGDWFWCPIHKGTERQFECQKSISSDDIMNKIKNLL